MDNEELASTLPSPDPESGKVRPDLEDFQDPHKVFHHLDRVFELARTGDTRPIHMTIGLTNYCNHRCPWCFINWNQAGRAAERSGNADGRRQAVNAERRLIEAVGEAAAMGLKAVTIVGDGEPTLHKRLAEYLEKLAGFGLDIGIFTNMSTDRDDVLAALTRHCFFVRCSIDAARPEHHRLTHGVDDFEKVVENLRRLVSLRGDRPYPIIGVQYVTNHWNYTDLPYAAAFYRDLGVDYMTIKPAYKNALNPSHPENELDPKVVFPFMRQAQLCSTSKFKVYAKFSQFNEVLEYEYNDGRYYKKCLATPISPYLDEDGNVEMCGNLKGRGFTLGNVFQNSFQEIWSSRQRRDCLSKIDLHACPSGCKLDPLNKVLWDSIYPDRHKIHTNFL